MDSNFILNINNKRVKCNLSTLMGKEKMDIQMVHELCNLNRNTVSGLFHEKVKRIDFETILKLCTLFNCSIGEFLEIVEEKPFDK